MAESFTATLVSNQDDGNFANNTSFSFSNTLPRTTDLSNYEVALQSIYLTDKHTKPSAVTPPPPPKNFFDLEKKENEVTVILAKTADLRVFKTSDDFDEFIKAIQTRITELTKQYTITAIKENEIVTSIKITYNPLPGWQLFLQAPLDRIFGFSNPTIGAGDHVSDAVPDIQFFKDHAIGVIAGLAEFKEERTQVEISQMNEKPDLDALMGTVAGELFQKGHDIAFEVNKKNSTLTYESDTVTKRYLLSPFLNSYLGLEENFEFYQQGTIKVPRKILFPSKQKPAPKSCSKLLVLCDILKPQIFAGKDLPLLAVLDRKTNESEVEISYEPHVPVYKPVLVGNVNHIGISIRDDNYQFIESQENPTVVNLHFRRMKDIFCDEKGSCKLVNMDLGHQTELPSDLIPIDMSRSRSPSPVRFVVRKKPIKAATKPKAVSKKAKPEVKGRPKKIVKKTEKVVKRGRPPTIVKPQKGKPQTKSKPVNPKKK